MVKGKPKKGAESASSHKKHKPALDTDPAQPSELNEEAFSDLSKKLQADIRNVHNYRKNPVISKSSASKAKERRDLSEARLQQGKKRNHEGKVLGKQKSEHADGGPNRDDTSVDALEKEVFALGGTAEDLELIAGIQSDSELEVNGETLATGGSGLQKDKSLAKGLSNILKEIGLAQRAGSADIDFDESEANEPAPEEEQRPVQVAHAPAGSAATASRAGKKPNVLFTPRPDWFHIPLPALHLSGPQTYTLPRYSMDQLYKYARSLLDSENENFNTFQQSSSSQNFYSTVIASGTLSDKISALTLAVQDSPLHNLKALETLVGLAKKRSRAQAVDVLRALKDLFAQGSLLPSDRKLYSFSTQPALLAAFGKIRSWNTGDALPGAVKPEHLMMWAYESWLKEQYFEVLKTLEIWCNDEIEFSKSRAVSYVFELLKERPEQESNLLRLLINKLGDPVKKIASQTSYLLMQLTAAHPLMKGTVVSAIESDLLFRPGQSLHAKYYAIVTLNQTALSSKEEVVATKLLDIYFSLFTGLLKPTEEPKKPSKMSASNEEPQGHRGRRRKQTSADKGAGKGPAQEEELREKLTSAILTGINRAYPYTDTDQQSLSVHMDTLFKIMHSSNFNTSIQAMMLVQQLCASRQISSERFYRTLYESLLDARLVTSSKQTLYLNLLYRALKADVNIKRVKAFAKRINQILTLHQPSFICGAFFLLKELETTFPGLGGMIDQPEEHEGDEENFQDVDEDGENAVQKQQELQAEKASVSASYDSRKRDPEHSNADTSCLWELIPFLAHFHPSVSVSADHLLRHAKLPGKPDLDLHTLIHFLDRFAYRNPKLASANLRGSSIMQPLSGGDASGLLVGAGSSGRQQIPVNTEGFRMKKDDDVAAEDVFFHKYFSSLGKEPPKTKAKGSLRGEDGSEADDGESEIWKAMVESAPDLEGAESEDDVEMADLESDIEDSLDELLVDDDDDDENEAGSEGIEGEMFDESDAMQGLGDDDVSDDVEVAAATPRVTGEVPSLTAVRSMAKEKRRKAKQLPTFASASDYAKMLDDEDGEDLGF